MKKERLILYLSLSSGHCSIHRVGIRNTGKGGWDGLAI